MAAARPVREEENKGSTGRGLGLAAAAVGVGVGVGAALYYFFNKRQEEGQHAETSADQQHERAFVSIPSDDSSNSESSEDSSSVNSVSISSDDTPSSASSGDSSSEDSLAEQEDMDLINAQIFRQRSWSLEECSICCEVMLPSSAPGGLRMLPCGHKFHTKCVQPWTEEHDTCPNCRKAC